jgi:hypothetical protein
MIKIINSEAEEIYNIDEFTVTQDVYNQILELLKEIANKIL